MGALRRCGRARYQRLCPAIWLPRSLSAPQALGAPAQLAAKAVRMRAHMLAGLIGLTALSGAFVAGMDAGHAYNECAVARGPSPWSLLKTAQWSTCPCLCSVHRISTADEPGRSCIISRQSGSL